MLLLLLLIGTGHDLWRAWRAPASPSPPPAPADTIAVSPSDTSHARPGAAAPARGVLDLNRASAAELDALPGIGPVLARRIVEYRRQHGPFRRIEELRAVRGVGPRLLERLRPRVGVAAGASVTP